MWRRSATSFDVAHNVSFSDVVGSYTGREKVQGTELSRRTHLTNRRTPLQFSITASSSPQEDPHVLGLGLSVHWLYKWLRDWPLGFGLSSALHLSNRQIKCSTFGLKPYPIWRKYWCNSISDGGNIEVTPSWIEEILKQFCLTHKILRWFCPERRKYQGHSIL